MPSDPGWSFKVAGVTFENEEDGSSRQAILKSVRAPHSCELRREPKNPYDKNAVAVHTAKGKIGYVPRLINRELLAWLKKNPKVVVTLMSVSKVPSTEILGARVKVRKAA